jgi:hypothetical protein
MKKQTQSKKKQMRSKKQMHSKKQMRSKKTNKKSIKHRGGDQQKFVKGNTYMIIKKNNDTNMKDFTTASFLTETDDGLYIFESIYSHRIEIPKDDETYTIVTYNEYINNIEKYKNNKSDPWLNAPELEARRPRGRFSNL